MNEYYFIPCAHCGSELYEGDEYIEYGGDALCIDCAVDKFKADEVQTVERMTKYDYELEKADEMKAERCVLYTL